jgi:hypothetical protein
MAFDKPGRLPGKTASRPWLVRQTNPFYGDATSIPRTPLVINTPVARQAGFADVIPNLLLTTLAAAAVSLPVGEQLFDSATAARAQTLADQNGRNEVIYGSNAQPPGEQLYANLPQQKWAVVADNWGSLAIRGSNQPPLTVGRQWSESAPPLKAPVVADNWRSLAVGGSNQQPSGLRIDAGAPAVRWLGADQWPSLNVTTLAPAVVGTIPLPLGLPVDTNGWKAKFEVSADNWRSLVILGSNQQPIGKATEGFQPPKWAVQADIYPNLLTSTLVVPLVAIPLPLALPVDVSQWMPKYSIQLDLYPNTVLVGIPPPAVVVPPRDTHDGWDAHRIHNYHVMRERDLKRRLAELSGKNNKKAKRLLKRIGEEFEDLARERAQALAEIARQRNAVDEDLLLEFVMAEEDEIAQLLAQAAELLIKTRFH